MTAARQMLGREGERVAARELGRQGWRILARNTRTQGVRGELDLVALDGDTLVFVEVKTGRLGAAAGPVSMLEMVGARKRAKLRALAAAWSREHRTDLPRTAGIRIDVVGIRLDAAGRVARWEHVRAAC